MTFKVQRFQCVANAGSAVKPPINITAKVYDSAGCSLEGDADGKSIPIPKHIDLMVRFMVECAAESCTIDGVHIIVPGSTNVYATVKRVP